MNEIVLILIVWTSGIVVGYGLCRMVFEMRKDNDRNNQKP